jgi:hypothetical protein
MNNTLAVATAWSGQKLVVSVWPFGLLGLGALVSLSWAILARRADVRRREAEVLASLDEAPRAASAKHPYRPSVDVDPNYALPVRAPMAQGWWWVIGLSSLAFVLFAFELPIWVAPPLLPFIVLASVLLAVQSASLLFVCGMQVKREGRLLPKARAGRVLVAVLGSLLMFGHIYAGALRMTEDLELVAPAGPRDLHVGQLATLTPRLGYTKRELLGSHRGVSASGHGFVVTSRSTVASESGQHTVSLEARRWFVTMQRDFVFQAERDVPPSGAELSVGMTWELHRRRGRDSGHSRERWIIIGAGTQRGLRGLWLVNQTAGVLGSSSRSRLQTSETRHFIYPMGGAWRVYSTDNETSQAFLAGNLSGACESFMAPGYACTCKQQELSAAVSVPSPVSCVSDDQSSGFERAVVGIFTLGFGSAAVYTHVDLVRVSIDPRFAGASGASQ